MLWHRMTRDPWWAEEVGRLRREMDRLVEGGARRPFLGFETRLFLIGDNYTLASATIRLVHPSGWSCLVEMP